MTCGAVIGYIIVARQYGNARPDDDDDHRRKPPAPPAPVPRPSGADIARDLVKDVKDQVPDTEDTAER